MKHLVLAAAVAIMVFSGDLVHAQTTRDTEIRSQTRSGVEPVQPLSEAERQRRRQSAAQRSQAIGNPDVLLEVPNLSVDEITLEVENLQVHLALDARVANLVKLTAGADASIEKVNLTIKGVQAEAYLVVRLDNVAAILDRTLTTIDRNPELLERLLQTVDTAVGTVGDVANTALQPGGVVSQTVNTLGQTVQRTLDTTGNIVEKTLDTTGRVVNERTVGKLLDLKPISETTNAAGNIVRQVRDASGAIIEYTLDRAGRIISSRVVSGATRR